MKHGARQILTGICLFLVAWATHAAQAPLAVPAAEKTITEELREAGGDPHRLDALFDRHGGAHMMIAELAGRAWQRVFHDPDLPEEERQVAAGKLRKYAEAMMADESTFTYQGRTIPMVRWKGQGLLASVEHMAAGKVMPDFGFTTLEREPASLADHRGTVLLIDFWATWCKPCVAAMPDLARFRNELQGKPFEIISIDSGDTIEKVIDFQSKEVSMPWINWHQETFAEEYFRLGIGTLPTYMVLDHNGVVLLRGGKFDGRTKQTILDAVEAATSAR